MTSSFKYTPDQNTAWNQGGELLAQWVQTLHPGASPEQIRPLIESLFASPEYIDWNPEQQSPTAILMQQATVLAMAVQSFTDRAAWAAQHCTDEGVLVNYDKACRVINSAMKYLPGGSK